MNFLLPASQRLVDILVDILMEMVNYVERMGTFLVLIVEVLIFTYCILNRFSHIKTSRACGYGMEEIKIQGGMRVMVDDLWLVWNCLGVSEGVEAGDALIQSYHNFITDFETKINLLKLAHFAVIVSRQYPEKEASIGYLEGVIEKLLATREMRIEEPILYIKMQIATFQLEKGSPKECKKLLEDRKSTLDSMTDIDPSVYANYYWISSQCHKSCQEFAEFYKSALLYLVYTWWSLYRNHLSWIWHLICPLLHCSVKTYTTLGNCLHIQL
ncbi:hypothetical protein CsSME_00049666 [Camellia sinensis var. sinensis]